MSSKNSFTESEIAAALYSRKFKIKSSSSSSLSSRVYDSNLNIENSLRCTSRSSSFINRNVNSVDKFGRDLIPYDKNDNNHRNRSNRYYDDDIADVNGHMRKIRSSSYSRDGFRNSRSRSRSCSRSRERRRNSIELRNNKDFDEINNSKWIHDRHTIDEPALVSMPKSYRPPSPKWKSLAGGVAIMKNK